MNNRAPARLRLTATCLALACSLAACSESGDDDPPATLPLAGADTTNPMATVPDGGTGVVSGDDPAGTSLPTGGTTGLDPAPIGAPTDQAPLPQPAPGPGSPFPADPAPAPGNPDTVSFECGGDLIFVGAGDTVFCDGVAYTLDPATGQVVPAEGSPTGPTGPTGPGGGSIAAQLRTAFVDENNLELWVCSASAAQSADVGYAFGAGGQGIYYLIEGSTTTGSAQFDWQATGPDSVLLNYPSTGTAEDISSIAFAGDGWTGFSNTDGQLDCGIAAIGNP